MLERLTLICVIAAAVQVPGASQLSFEVASIRPNNSENRSSDFSTNATGRFNATNVTVKSLLITAYKLQEYQLVGGPPWLGTDRYDIVAKPEEKASADEVLEMIKTLLAERFKLRLHHETRELPVYALFVGKNGSKMKASSTDGNDNHSSNVRRGMMTGQNLPLEMFVIILSNQLDRPVVDRTGLAGNFDLRLEWSPEASRPSAEGVGTVTSGPSIFTAIQEQLGLRLEATKGPVEVIVIDSVERPSEN
jgi:bla regulator protein blaR1